MLSQFSFGTYRTSNKNTIHKDAIIYAIEQGIKDFDTSSNYMFGDAERLIGEVLKDKNRAEFTIVSKGGYIQGPNMQRVLDGWEVQDLVKYDKNCYHCIHADFISDQIDKSLERLQTDYIDVYLLHNPEYYLMNEIKPNSSKEEISHHQQIMQERIKKAFELLEHKVKEGKIKYYGISSNSFSKKHDDIHFLDYKYLITYAQEASLKNNNKKHHLKVLQLPMNFLETDGIKCGKWAKEHNLDIHINRPLNAFNSTGMIRLADYKLCEEYENIKEEITSLNNDSLNGVITQLVSIMGQFRWAGDVDDTIDYQVVPYINQNLKLTQNEIDTLNKYLKCYKQNVKHNISLKTKQYLESIDIKIENSIDEKAINFLKNQNFVTKILVGMRTKEYVNKVLQYAK
jgi:aryl-alcohol dehydrogenase-like predicted oxidoreductase